MDDAYRIKQVSHIFNCTVSYIHKLLNAERLTLIYKEGKKFVKRDKKYGAEKAKRLNKKEKNKWPPKRKGFGEVVANPFPKPFPKPFPSIEQIKIIDYTEIPWWNKVIGPVRICFQEALEAGRPCETAFQAKLLKFCLSKMEPKIFGDEKDSSVFSPSEYTQEMGEILGSEKSFEEDENCQEYIKKLVEQEKRGQANG